MKMSTKPEESTSSQDAQLISEEEITNKLRSIQNFVTLSKNLWTDAALDLWSSGELIKNLDDVRVKEIEYLKAFWEGFPLIPDEVHRKKAIKATKDLESVCEKLAAKLQAHIDSAKQREFDAAKSKADEEEASRNQKATQSQTIQWEEDEKKSKELEEAKREITKTKKDRDQRISDLNKKLSAETKKLEEASKEATDCKKKGNKAREDYDKETERLSQEKDALKIQIDNMITEDTLEDEAYEKEIREHKENLDDLKEKHEGEMDFIEREREIDQDFLEFQLSLHRSLIQDLKQTAKRFPRSVDQTDAPEIVSNAVLIEDLKGLARDLKMVDTMSNINSLEQVTRTELLWRKETIAGLATDYNAKYTSLNQKTMKDEKKKEVSDAREKFVADAKSLTDRIDEYVKKSDQETNTPADEPAGVAPPTQTTASTTNNSIAGVPDPKLTIPNARKIVPFNYKLESIELENFSGDLTEWNAWSQMFKLMVHENKNIPTLMKLHVLRSHLKGLALETVTGYQLTAENYYAAWEDLQTRFNRKDNIIHEYIKKFIEVPILKAHSPYQKMFTVINGTKQMIQALPGLGVVVAHWDPFILFVLLSKLDEETRRAWKNHVGRKENASVGELLDFLETKAIESQPSMSDHMYDLLSGKKAICPKGNAPKIFLTENAGGSGTNQRNSGEPQGERVLWRCPKCPGNHQLSWCGEYKRMTLEDRRQYIKDQKLCFKCLGPHLFRNCTAKNCPTCSRAHHSSICPKKADTVPRRDFKSKN